MKILITGTHFTPAQAVIEQFQKEKNLEIVYIGRLHTREGDKSPSAESQILPKLGVKFYSIAAGRLQRSFTIYTIPSLLKVPLGFIQSFLILVREHPDVILSFGGYLSVPVVWAAWLLSIPVIIHEQTLIPGLANTISSWFASRIALSFPIDKTICDKRVVITGNPMRKDLIKQSQGKTEIFGNDEYKQIIKTAKSSNLPLVFITGGNQGSHIINENINQILPDLTKVACVIHQTGDSKYNDFDEANLVKNKLEHPLRYLAKKWIDAADLNAVFSHTDVLISRAGVNTLMEAAVFQIPVLLIPIPNHKEQAANAKFFEKLGIAHVLPQNKLNPESLLVNITEMIKSYKELKIKAGNAKSIIIHDAASRVALETILTAQKNND